LKTFFLRILTASEECNSNSRRDAVRALELVVTAVVLLEIDLRVFATFSCNVETLSRNVDATSDKHSS
jgi:hypothetical protein